MLSAHRSVSVSKAVHYATAALELQEAIFVTLPDVDCLLVGGHILPSSQPECGTGETGDRATGDKATGEYVHWVLDFFPVATDQIEPYGEGGKGGPSRDGIEDQEASGEEHTELSIWSAKVLDERSRYGPGDECTGE